MYTYILFFTNGTSIPGIWNNTEEEFKEYLKTIDNLDHYIFNPSDYIEETI